MNQFDLALAPDLTNMTLSISLVAVVVFFFVSRFRLFSILGKWPNTYAFTKALSEDLIRMNGKNLPLGMFRPAIVTSSVREPVVGYIDNLYGPTGVVAGAGTGVLRTMHCNPDITANIVPVDMTVSISVLPGERGQS